MWAEALELLQDAERLQRQFFQVGVLQGAPCWEPPVDLYENGVDLRLLVALPGVTPRQVEVVLAPGLIIVRGERSLPAGSDVAVAAVKSAMAAANSAYDSFTKVVKQATDMAEANVTAATATVVKQAGKKKAA